MYTGTTISHYQIGDVLGQGGMGTVYRATDTRLDRAVAVKFLSQRLTFDPTANARFIREAKAASALDHPNICTIHDIGETDTGELYLVMALYEGDTLKRRLATEQFSVERVTRIVTQVARALKRAHTAGIIHRDIKPANIMVGPEDQVRLLDFGIAKLQADESLTDTGTTVGTTMYMSPEQALAESVTPATDVWSLGVVMYEMLTGQLPFKGEQPMAVIRCILQDEPEPAERLRSEVPPELAVTLLPPRQHRDPALPGRLHESVAAGPDLRRLQRHAVLARSRRCGPDPRPGAAGRQQPRHWPPGPGQSGLGFRDDPGRHVAPVPRTVRLGPGVH